MVVRPDRHAAGHDHDVRRERALAAPPRSRRSRRRPSRRASTRRAGRDRLGRDGVPVGVADLARAQRRGRRDQLVAGDDDRDARARARTRARRRPWRPPLPARRGRGASRPQHRARRRGCPRPPAGSPCRAAAARLTPQLRVLLPASSTRSTASAPGGTIAPVEIATASPRPEPTPRTDAPARDSPTSRSDTGRAGRRPGDVGGAQREPVHRRVVEPGHVVGARRRRARARARAPPRAAPPPAARRGPARAPRPRPRAGRAGCCPRAPSRERLSYRLRRPRATASSALSVSRPPTFSGSFTASAAPSMARRGRPGALPGWRRRAACLGRAGAPAEALGEAARRPAGGRALRGFGLAAVSPRLRPPVQPVLLAAAAHRRAPPLTGALRAGLRKPAHDVGRARGRRGLAGALRAALRPGLRLRGLGLALGRGGARGARSGGLLLSIHGCLPSGVGGSGGASDVARRPARPILLAEPTATRLVWNSTHQALGTAVSSRPAGPSSPEVPPFRAKTVRIQQLSR